MPAWRFCSVVFMRGGEVIGQFQNHLFCFEQSPGAFLPGLIAGESEDGE
jgi:hypothetical protein